MREIICKKCGGRDLFLRESDPNTGLYCAGCGTWQKWVGKKELPLVRHCLNQQKQNPDVMDNVHVDPLSEEGAENHGTIFTDQEYRLLLAALSREKEVCRKVDRESSGDVNLERLMDNISRKISGIQYSRKKKIKFYAKVEYCGEELTATIDGVKGPEEAYSLLTDKGFEVLSICDADAYHICPGCGEITKGSDSRILCDDCVEDIKDAERNRY